MSNKEKPCNDLTITHKGNLSTVSIKPSNSDNPIKGTIKTKNKGLYLTIEKSQRS